jgi:uncharacterized protein (DUF58 family)
MTARAWWFLILLLSILSVGVCNDLRGLTVLGLTLLFWFLWSWFWFAFRTRLLIPDLVVKRQISDDQGRVDNLWTGRSFRVDVEVENKGKWSLPFARLADFVPLNAKEVRGTSERDAALRPGDPVSMRYAVKCAGPGRMRFEGVSLQVVDPQAFFYHRTFLHDPVVLRILPPLADAEGRRPTVKRHNLLPSPGLHRHLRPGSGSELLDLRDYLPGDPPKTIAWKVSARRDRLITKEFETEVPIRCTLFVDTSHSVRVGPRGGNALTRLADISAAVAQASAASRDLCGLCLVDEEEVTHYTKPARGSRHLVQLLNRLAEAADLAPATGQSRLPVLLNVAHALAGGIYPQMLRHEINRVPLLLPFLWPVGGDRLFSAKSRWVLSILFLFAGLIPLAGMAALLFGAGDIIYSLAQVFIPLPELLLRALIVAVLLTAALLYFGVLRFCFQVLTGALGAGRRRLVRFRKRLASLTSALYGLGPGGVGALLEDDEMMALYLQRFMADHEVPYPLALYDDHGRYLFSSPGKVEVIARALLRAVGKGHDNELFVLLVDLIELTDYLAPLQRAVKVTLARHHQLLVICPWPPGIPTPNTNQPAADMAANDLSAALREATVRRYHAAYHRLQRTFARMGVPVICAAEGDSARLILDRLDRLRYMGLGRRR